MSPRSPSGGQPPVLVFMRAPAPGTVKTRLAAHLAPEVVLELYTCMVEDTLEGICSAGLVPALWVHPPRGIAMARARFGVRHALHPQQGRDLGERMAGAFRSTFAAGTDRALLVGTDVPDLPAEVYRAAAVAIDEAPAVIGPARDGGYYLIGFRREAFLPEVFEGIAWGTPRVFTQTRKAFNARGLAPRLLAPWRDLDRIEDLAALGRSPGGAGARTRACLRRMGIGPRTDPGEGAAGGKAD